MIRMKTLLLALILVRALQAAIPSNTRWEVRPTLGASTNGGGFVVNGSGTNYSLNNNANAAGCSNCGSASNDISTTDAVAVGTTTITSLTANFTTVLPGNIIYFTGGTGSIAAVRRHVTARASATSMTIDASIAASTGMTMNIGGSLDDIATALTANTVQNTICVKATGTLVRTANLTLNNNLSPLSYNALFGYTTTCGDHGPVTIQLSTNTGLKAIDGSGAAGWWIDGFVIDCATLGTSTGLDMSAGQYQLTNLLVKDCRTRLLNTGSIGVVTDSEFTGCSSACTAAITLASNTVFERNYVHDNAILCVDASGGKVILNYNVFDTCTGASTDGIKADFDIALQHNIFYNIDRDSLTFLGSSGHILLDVTIKNNIFDTAGRYCLNGAGTAIPASPNFDGNAYFGCTTAARRNIDSTDTSTYSYSYTNVYDVTLTASPFVDAANKNFALNATAGGGAAVKGVGTPGTIPGVTGTGYPDLGAFQSQAPAASTGCACGFSK